MGAVTHPPVTFVASHAARGGQNAYLTSILRGLGRERIAGLIALQDGPALPAMAAVGASMWVLPTPGRAGIPLSVVRLRRLLLGGRAQLVHADGPKAALCARLATAGTGIPVVWMRYDGAFDGWVARAIATRCHAVVGISRAVLDTFDGLRGPAVELVRCGIPEHRVDRAEAGRELRALLGASVDARVVVQAGRIVANKGQLDTVAAAAAVLTTHPEVRFAFVGEPDRTDAGYAAQVHARVRELGIEDAVSFLGYVPDAVRAIAGADVLVMPSQKLPGFYGWREGFGLVVAEAMAVGTPVIAYDDPALVETLAGCGELVPSGDHAALARAVLALLADPERRTRMAEAGHERARELSFDRALEELRAVYARLAYKKPRYRRWVP